MKKVAMIPARGGSTGIIEKNLKLVGKLSLVQRAILQSQQAQCFDDIVVSTDHAIIQEQAIAMGATVQNRPDEFRYDNTIQEVDRLLIHMQNKWEMCNKTKIDITALIYPTAPLRRPSTIRSCMALVSEQSFDSCLTLHQDSSYLWKVNEHRIARPTNYDPATRGPRQKECWNQWVENKAVYVFRRQVMEDAGCRIVGRCGYIEVSPFEGIDIDNPHDILFANWLLDSGHYDDEL